MRSLSLRTRVASLVCAVVAITLALALTVAYGLADRRLDSQLNDSVHDQAAQLAQTLLADQPGSAAAALSLTRAYAVSRPLGRSSTLLFLLIPGVGCASNYPALFGDYPVTLGAPHPGLHTIDAPAVGLLRTDELSIAIAGHRAYVGAGTPISSTRSTEHQLLISFLLAGLAAMALAGLAALLLARRTAAPISELAAVATQVSGGDLSPRVALPDSASRELRTLADAFNRMLDRLTNAFEAQREFVADASHELRTPLTVIRGQLDLLAGSPPPDETEIARVRGLIAAEIARVTRLVDDLLLLAGSDREGFLVRSEVSLPELVTEIWDGLSLIAQRSFQLGRLDPATLSADPDRLAQALRNLARNAIAHTEAPDGLVRVDVEADAGEHGDMVRIWVSDDGPGISVTQREEVFERFTRLDPARTRAAGGAGLGLAIVRAIVLAHGGTVSVNERPGGGAAFLIELPR